MDAIKINNFESHWTLEDYIRFVGNGAKKLVERAFDETLDEKLRIFNTRIRNVFNINSSIALINDGT